MTDPGFDLALAIRISGAARQRDDTVVRQHVAVEGVQRGIVDVWRDHSFAQVVEHDEASDPTQAAEGSFMEFHPEARAGVEGKQTNGFAAVAQCQHEQPYSAVAATGRVTDHGAGAVVDLGLLASRSLDHYAGFR